MLDRSLEHVALGAFFANRAVGDFVEKVAAEEVPNSDDYMAEPISVELGRAVSHGIDQAWPRRFRLNEVQQAAALLCEPGVLEIQHLPFMDDVIGRIFTDDPVCSYRLELVETYSRLVAELDPTILVGWRLTTQVLLEAGPQDRAHIETLIEQQFPLFAPQGLRDLTVGENHVHLGGVSPAEFVLARKIFLGPASQENEEIRLLRRMLLVFMSPDLTAQAVVKACRSPFEKELAAGDWWTLKEQHAARADRVSWLQRMTAEYALQRDFRTSWLWLNVLLWTIFRDAQATASKRAAVLLFFVRFGGLRSTLIAEGRGLRRFVQRYYAAPLRKSGKSSYEYGDVMARIFVEEADVAELKVSPKMLEPETIRNVLRSRCRAFGAPAPDLTWTPTTTAAAVDHYVQNADRLHFCALFIRENERGAARQTSIARRKRRDEIWLEAEHLRSFGTQESGWSDSHFTPGGKKCDGGLWLRGLDVAGDETAWPIEYFAPQIRWLRSVMKAVAKLEGGNESRAMHLSVHAGEDYAHPLSGLRHIDETISFCGMGSGDRLGHALAIGIPPRLWAERHGDVLLPLEEHFDNLVWAWQQCTEHQQDLPQSKALVESIELRLPILARQIDWAAPYAGSDPVEFVNAWRLRRNCTHQLANLLQSDRPDIPSEIAESGVPDRIDLYQAYRNKAACSTAHKIFFDRNAAARGLDNRQPLVRVRMVDRAVGAAGLIQKHVFEDMDSSDDFELFEAFQDLLIERCKREDIAIEANPTSNVYIAPLHSHSEHPIFRWYPPPWIPTTVWNRFGLRTGVLKVLVNTDDPGIMPTTLRMELDLLRCAATGLPGGTPEGAEAWVQGLRDYGTAEFQRTHRNVFR